MGAMVTRMAMVTMGMSVTNRVRMAMVALDMTAGSIAIMGTLMSMDMDMGMANQCSGMILVWAPLFANLLAEQLMRLNFIHFWRSSWENTRKTFTGTREFLQS